MEIIRQTICLWQLVCGSLRNSWSLIVWESIQLLAKQTFRKSAQNPCAYATICIPATHHREVWDGKNTEASNAAEAHSSSSRCTHGPPSRSHFHHFSSRVTQSDYNYLLATRDAINIPIHWQLPKLILKFDPELGKARGFWFSELIFCE